MLLALLVLTCLALAILAVYLSGTDSRLACAGSKWGPRARSGAWKALPSAWLEGAAAEPEAAKGGEPWGGTKPDAPPFPPVPSAAE